MPVRVFSCPTATGFPQARISPIEQLKAKTAQDRYLLSSVVNGGVLKKRLSDVAVFSFNTKAYRSLLALICRNFINIL